MRWRFGKTTHRYRVYGLVVASDSEIPELERLLVSDRRTPDVVLSLKPLEMGVIRDLTPILNSSRPDGTPWLVCSKTSGGYLLSFADHAEFWVGRARGQVICVRTRGEIPDNTLRHLLLDQAFPFVLNVLGKHPIHATAVSVRGGVCAFIGPAGSGKSTLAASLLVEGHKLFADDCLPLIQARGKILAVPAYPGLRLWRDVSDAMGISGRSDVKVSHYSEKSRMVAFSTRFASKPAPLVRIYAVERDDDATSSTAPPSIEPLLGRDALLPLIRASYSFDVTDRRALKRDFDFLAALATSVPVRRLRVVHDLTRLSAVREAVLSDLDN
jgi:hypothetical protein